MTDIAILGTGRVGTVLAAKFAAGGLDVAIGTRDAAKAASLWTGPSVTFGDAGSVAGRASVIVNATPGDSSVERLRALQSALGGKILVDVANASLRRPDGMPGGLLYPDSSLGEQLQQTLPDTRVVKTLNTMMFMVMANPTSLSIPPTAFLSGNDGGAKATVVELLGRLDWPADWILDLGDITTARGPEAMMLMVPALLRSRGFAPFAFTLAR
jgi:predicted dinucleotide-binding enzyme